MSTSFSKLKNASSNFEDLQKKLKATASGKKSYKDERIWQYTQDKAGNASATIRFLPAPEGEDMPYVQLHQHTFKGPGGQWIFENCPTTLGKDQTCPICEANGLLWNSGIESDKKIVSERKRKLSYYSNILVVKDPVNPDNEGKVFLFKYGKSIFDKLADAMSPIDPDDAALNPFDLWTGANFKLRITKKEGFTNYDKSLFDAPQPIGNDDEAKQIWDAEYSLAEIVSPDKFKTYAQLKDRFDTVMNGSPMSRAEETELGEDDYQQAPAPSRSIDEDLGEDLDDIVKSISTSTEPDLSEYSKYLTDED